MCDVLDYPKRRTDTVKRCRACGNDEIWCSVYTGCPLNKGNAHDLVKPRDIPTQPGRNFQQFDYKAGEAALPVPGLMSNEERAKKFFRVYVPPDAKWYVDGVLIPGLTNLLLDVQQEEITRIATRLRKIGDQCEAGGHKSRARMFRAIAKSFEDKKL